MVNKPSLVHVVDICLLAYNLLEREYIASMLMRFLWWNIQTLFLLWFTSEAECVRGLHLWRTNYVEINDELFKGHYNGNDKGKINEILAGWSLFVFLFMLLFLKLCTFLLILTRFVCTILYFNSIWFSRFKHEEFWCTHVV